MAACNVTITDSNFGGTLTCNNATLGHSGLHTVAVSTFTLFGRSWASVTVTFGTGDKTLCKSKTITRGDGAL